jgi:hypothetical protein
LEKAMMPAGTKTRKRTPSKDVVKIDLQTQEKTLDQALDEVAPEGTKVTCITVRGRLPSGDHVEITQRRRPDGTWEEVERKLIPRSSEQ